jgi:hypothetical protein
MKHRCGRDRAKERSKLQHVKNTPTLDPSVSSWEAEGGGEKLSELTATGTRAVSQCHPAGKSCTPSDKINCEKTILYMTGVFPQIFLLFLYCWNDGEDGIFIVVPYSQLYNYHH